LIIGDQVPVKWRSFASSPVVQTSLGPVPETESRWPPPNTCVENAVPFQCKIEPIAVIHTSLALNPQTASRSAVVGLATDDHEVPLNRRIVPPTPTAQTFDELAAHTPSRLLVVPLDIVAHPLLERRTIVPPLPTANTSLALTAHTACRRVVVVMGAVSWHHVPGVAGVWHAAVSAKPSVLDDSSVASRVRQPEAKARTGARCFIFIQGSRRS